MENARTDGKVISFINMKGGVGKTTLCKDIAYFLGKTKSYKILLIDVDPQCNLTQSFFEKYNIVRNDQVLQEKIALPSIEDLLQDDDIVERDASNFILPLGDNLDLIPGEMTSRFMKRGLNAGTGAQEQILLNFIEDKGLRNKYKYIFIDCPPTYSFHTNIALLASDYYLVPVKPDTYSILGIDLLLDVIDTLTKGNRLFKTKPLSCAGVVFTMTDKNKRIKKQERRINTIKKILEVKGVNIFSDRFYSYNRITLDRLSTFILDRNAEELKVNLEKICNAFEEVII